MPDGRRDDPRAGTTHPDEFDAESDDERQRVFRLLEEARSYTNGFEWCKAIQREYIGIAVGGVVGVFLFEIEPSRADVDEWIWVIVGDLPPAYITTDDAPNPAAALDAYIGAMEEWVGAVRNGDSVDELIPVNAAASPEVALMLESRLEFLDEKILSSYRHDLED